MRGFDPQAGRSLPDDPPPGSPRCRGAEDELRSGLAGLAGVVANARAVDEVLADVAGFARRAIPGVVGAGVALIQPCRAVRLQARAATAPFVGEIDEIQYETVGEGPCLTCMDTRRPAVSGSVGSDERWRRFGGRVARLGVHSALSLPLLVADRVVGAINAYAYDRDVFGEHAVQLGAQFAGPAAVSVFNAQLLYAARDKADQLDTALTSRGVIDQAIGIVRSRVGGSEREAFERLRQMSQRENIKVADIAHRLVDEAVRRARARHATPEQSPAVGG